MFLMSDAVVRQYMSRRGLDISPFDKNNLGQTCYYFRAGRNADILTDDAGLVDIRRTGLSLPAGTTAVVESRERFKLPENVLGLLGVQTDLPVEKKLQLIHGPSIDPGYNAPIEVVLMNIGHQSIDLRFEERIGKIMFFDVSETGIAEAHLFAMARMREDRLMERWDREDPDADSY